MGNEFLTSDGQWSQRVEAALKRGSTVTITPNTEMKTFSKEYTSSVTDEVVDTPAADEVIVVDGVLLAGDGNSGEIRVTINSKLAGVLYVSNQTSSTAMAIRVVGSAGQPLKVTTTTGSDKAAVIVSYHVEDAP